MVKKCLVSVLIAFVFLVSTPIALAASKGAGEVCDVTLDTCPQPDYSCQFDNITNSNLCLKKSIGSIFGKIQAPSPLADFLINNPTGGGAISQFLSNGITLIYSIAGIVLVFMLLMGAFEWMVSGGDKEKMSSAQKRIISAIVGILLFAVAFAVIRVLGQFTGFKFFN